MVDVKYLNPSGKNGWLPTLKYSTFIEYRRQNGYNLVPWLMAGMIIYLKCFTLYLKRDIGRVECVADTFFWF